MANKLSEGKPIKCRICGKTFVPRGSTTVTCSDECRRENARRQREKWRKKHRAVVKANRIKGLSIGEVSKMAREAGMSYGQYVSEINKEVIE